MKKLYLDNNHLFNKVGIITAVVVLFYVFSGAGGNFIDGLVTIVSVAGLMALILTLIISFRNIKQSLKKAIFDYKVRRANK